MTACLHKKDRRVGTAAVEFAACAPLMLLLMLGLWEVGRSTEVHNVLWNAARECGRDASMGQTDMKTLASNLLTYLQSAEPSTFGSGHQTSMIAPVVSLPANTVGYTCWDNTKDRELFTVTFTNITNSSVTDPTKMQQLDHYQIGIRVPYASVGWLPTAQITGQTQLSVTVDWVSMVDSPFQITPSLPAQ